MLLFYSNQCTICTHWTLSRIFAFMEPKLMARRLPLNKISWYDQGTTHVTPSRMTTHSTVTRCTNTNQTTPASFNQPDMTCTISHTNAYICIPLVITSHQSRTRSPNGARPVDCPLSITTSNLPGRASTGFSTGQLYWADSSTLMPRVHRMTCWSPPGPGQCRA